MDNGEIKVNGNFAVKVGKLWARNDYNEVSLHEQPKSLMTFKDAYDLNEKVGGEIYIFNPRKLDLAEVENLKLAAGIGTGRGE